MAGLEGTAEGLHGPGGGALELLLGNRVVGNQIHMALEAPQKPREGLGMAGLVVDAPQQHVFKAQPPAGECHIAATVLQQRLQGIGVGGGDQLLPQALIRGVQAHRQGELGPPEPLQGPGSQGWQGFGHADGADRDLALGHAQIAAEAVDGGQHCLNIEQGLAHAHEHHVAGALVHHLAHAQHLVDNFMDRKGALQPPLACGTEAAGHRAAHLAADAHREPALGRDADGFKAEAVVGAEQQLGGAIAGHAAVQLPRTADPIEASFGGGGSQLLAKGLGQHTYGLQAAGTLGIEPVMQLPAAEGSLAVGYGPPLQLRQAHPQQGSGRRHLDHPTQGQINRPWPSFDSTASRAMKPSMAMRPLSSSVWEWKPKRGKRRWGTGVPRLVRSGLAMGVKQGITHRSIGPLPASPRGRQDRRSAPPPTHPRGRGG